MSTAWLNMTSLVALVCIAGCDSKNVEPSASGSQTKLGTFIGTFQPSFFTYVDSEQPQVLRAILKDDDLALMANQGSATADYLSFLQEVSNRDIEVIVTIRFPHKQINEEDRVIWSADELNQVMANLTTVLNLADGKIQYLQVLNEPFGIGRYNSTLDSLAAIHSQAETEHMVLDWMDTITQRFRKVIDNNGFTCQLLSPSVQAKGLEAVKNNQTQLWTYKLTTKIFDLANTWCDGLNFHWYPESIESMRELMDFADRSDKLQTTPSVFKTCTEWSQAHEIRDVLQLDTSYWETELAKHCDSQDNKSDQEYINLVNSLPITYEHTYEMYQLMNERGYKFAAYFAMVQDFYTCGEISNSWYALASLYATKFTANKLPNGKFHEQYQRMKELTQ